MQHAPHALRMAGESADERIVAGLRRGELGDGHLATAAHRREGQHSLVAGWQPSLVFAGGSGRRGDFVKTAGDDQYPVVLEVHVFAGMAESEANVVPCVACQFLRKEFEQVTV